MNRSVALRGGAVLSMLLGFVPGLLFLVIGFVGGVYVDQRFLEYVPFIGHRSESNVDLSQVQEAVRLIQADYVDGNLDSTKLSHGTVQGLVNSLGDPFTVYFDPEQYKRLQQSYQGKYTGIGIYLSFSTGYPVISGTVPGSPAAFAGLKAGDQVVKVGDKDIKGITADQATALIQGPEGTKVTLTILRGTESMTFTITRAQIQAPTVALLVLVEANIASAAEIVAGALQVHQRGKLVRTTTFGKGSVQEDFVLSDGSDLHLTVQRWFLPNGQTIDHKGLTPDVTVTLPTPTDAYDVSQPSQGYAKDTQLNAALGLLPGG